MANGDPIKDLRGILVSEGYLSDQITEDDFARKILNPDTRKEFRGILVSEGFLSEDIDDVAFDTRLGFDQDVDFEPFEQGPDLSVGPSTLQPTVTDGTPPEYKEIPVVADAVRAAERGVYQAQAAGALDAYGGTSEDAIARYAEAQRNAVATPPSEAYTKFTQSKGWSEAAGAFAEAPATILGELVAESTGMFLTKGWKELLGAASIGMAAPPAAIPATMVAVGKVSFDLEYTGVITENLMKAGYDVENPEDVKSALSNEEFIESVREDAIKKGLTIGLVDAATMGLVQKFGGSRTVRKLLGRRGRAAGAGAAEMVGGGVGEALGSAAIGEEAGAGAILSEMFGEGPGVVINTVLAKQRAGANNQQELISAVIDGDRTDFEGQVNFQKEIGQLSEEQANDLIGRWDEIQQRLESLPSDIKSAEKRKTILNLIERREQVKNQPVDEALISKREEEIEKINEQIRKEASLEDVVNQLNQEQDEALIEARTEPKKTEEGSTPTEVEKPSQIQSDEAIEGVSEDLSAKETETTHTYNEIPFQKDPETNKWHRVKRDGTLYKKPASESKQVEIEQDFQTTQTQTNEQSDTTTQPAGDDTSIVDSEGLPQDSEAIEEGREVQETPEASAQINISSQLSDVIEDYDDNVKTTDELSSSLQETFPDNEVVQQIVQEYESSEKTDQDKDAFDEKIRNLAVPNRNSLSEQEVSTVDEVTNEIIQQNETEQIPQGAVQEGTRLTGQAKTILDRSGASAATNQEGGRRDATEIRAREGQALIQFAKQTNNLVDLNETDTTQELEGGAENKIYFQQDGKTVVKVNNGNLNNTRQELLDRLELHNELFPETAYTVLGFTEQATGNQDGFGVVLQQPFIEGDAATNEQIQADLEKRGFTRIDKDGGGDFVKDDIMINDVFKNDGDNPNVMVKGGVMFYIDPNIKRVDLSGNIEAQIKSERNQLRSIEEELFEEFNKLQDEVGDSGDLFTNDTGGIFKMLDGDFNLDDKKSVAKAFGQIGKLSKKQKEFFGEERLNRLKELHKQWKDLSTGLTPTNIKKRRENATKEQTKKEAQKQKSSTQEKKSQRQGNVTGRGNFAERVKSDKSVPKAFRDKITDEIIEYTVKQNVLTDAEAQYVVDNTTIDEAVKLVTNPTLSGLVRVNVGMKLVKKISNEAKKASSQQEANRLYDQAIDVLNKTSQLGRDAGRIVQSFTMWRLMGPEGYVRWADKALTDIKVQVSKKHKSLVKAAMDSSNKAKRRAASRVSNSISMEPKKSRARQMRESALEKIKRARGNLTTGGLSPEMIEGLAEYGYSYILEGVDTFTEFMKRMKGKFDWLSTADVRDVWNSTHEGKTLKQHANEGVSFENMIADNIDKNLSKALQDTFGISAEKADNLSKKLKQRFNKEYKREFQKAMKNSVPQKNLRDLVEDLSNVDNLTETEVLNKINKKLGIPETLSAEDFQEITDLAKKIQELPEDSMVREEGIAQVLNFIKDKLGPNAEEYLGFKKDSVLWGLWYASILSGVRTQALNVGANSWKLLTENLVTSIFEMRYNNRDPELTRRMFKHWKASFSEFVTKGSKGRAEFKEILFEGKKRSDQASKFFDESRLEERSKELRVPKSFNLKEVGEQTLNVLTSAAKYVPRFMSAWDAIFYWSNFNARLTQTTLRAGIEKGLRGKSLDQFVNDTVYGSETAISAAEEQARQELEGRTKVDGKPYTQSDIRRRTDEILQKNLSDTFNEEMYEDAVRYGQLGTFTQDPQGHLGAMVNSINNFTNEFPAARIIIPFTRIVGNVLNDQIDYTPYGFIRAKGWNVGGRGKSLGYNLSQEERQRIQVKAEMGLFLTGISGMILASMLGDEDDDKTIKIHGRGPKDWEKRKLLMGTNWQPSSIQIGDTFYSFKELNVGLWLGWIGEIADAMRYGDTDEIEYQADYAMWAIMRTPQIILEASFLSGLSDFFEDVILSAQKNETAGKKKIESWLTGQTRPATPNLFKQMLTAFDNKLYQSTNYKEQLYKYHVQPWAATEMFDGKLNAHINALGDEVRYGRDNGEGKIARLLGVSRFVNIREEDPVYVFLADKRISVPPLSYAITFNKENVAKMYPDKFRRIAIKKGQIMKEHIRNNLKKYEKMKRSEINKNIKDRAKKATQEAKEFVLGKSKSSKKRRKL